ncbi:MAG: tetratricopeptide repeat protein [Capsulimonadales bacterium]|nr:tetratricopeptide repeat protein [Capsulimonadales bacterium]
MFRIAADRRIRPLDRTALCFACLLFAGLTPVSAQDAPNGKTPEIPPTDRTPPSAPEMTPEEYIRKATIYSRVGDYTKAVAVLTKAIEEQPNTAQLFLHRGQAYIRMAAAEQRIVECTRAISRNGEDTVSFLHRGFAYYNIGNYLQAISDYTRAIVRQPDYAAAYLGRGLAFIAAGKRTEGMADYERALRLRPELQRADPRYLLMVRFDDPIRR